jgi:hypothetical protein
VAVGLVTIIATLGIFIAWPVIGGVVAAMIALSGGAGAQTVWLWLRERGGETRDSRLEAR